MKDIINSLTKTFIALIHSKRAWAVLASMVMLLAKEFWPDKAESIYAAIAMIGTWVLGESFRPVAEKHTRRTVERYYPN